MGKRILQIVETAYRATLEEQDDPVLWLSAALRNGGTDVDILLRGAATNYVAREQNASGLEFGAWRQKHPPDIVCDLTRLQEKGAAIFAVEEDVKRRALVREDVLDGISLVSEKDLPALLSKYDLAWRW